MDNKEQGKKLYVWTKEKQQEWRKGKITCMCGTVITKGSWSYHLRSKKHNLLMMS